MRKTTQLIAGCLVAYAIPSASAAVGPLSGGNFAPGMVALGAETVGYDRIAAEDWLYRARQELSQGNFEMAEKCLAEAEKFKASFDPLGDNPTKARRDLEFAKRTGRAAPAAAPAPRTPSDRTPLASAASDRSPKAGRDASLYDAQVTPVAAQSASQRSARGGDRTACDALLQDARTALSLGDVRKAGLLCDQASAMGVTYDAAEDSPSRVKDHLQRHQLLAAEGVRHANSETYKRKKSDLLVEQAEWLKQWGKLDEAERLATEAMGLGLRYGLYDRTPSLLLEEITAARKGIAKGNAIYDPEVKPVGNAVERLPSAPSTRSGPAPLASPRSGGVDPTMDAKAQASMLLDQAREAVAAGDFAKAEQLAKQAQSLNVRYAPYETRPETILFDVSKAKAQGGGGLPGRTPAAPSARQVGYEEAAPSARSGRAAEEVPADYASGAMPEAVRLFRAGEEAMRNRETDRALLLYRDAYAMQDQLDARTRQVLQDRLATLGGDKKGPASAGSSMLSEADSADKVLVNQLSSEVERKKSEAARLKDTDVRKALAVLDEAREKVEDSAADPKVKEILLRRISRDYDEMSRDLEVRRPVVERQARNQKIKDDMDREKRNKVEVSEKLALMVEDFNKLMKEQRYREAELIARRAQLFAPDEVVVQSMLNQSRFVRDYARTKQIAEDKERGFVSALNNVEESAVPFDDNKPYQMPNAKDWSALTATRAHFNREKNRLTETEVEIQQKLKTPVSLQFTNKPLSEVMAELGTLTAINVFLDPQGLSEEGVNTQTPVTINLSQPISMESALNLILQPLNLSYVIKDEVLKVTSKQMRNGEVYPVVYNVADLVVPIPNFVPSGSMGLASAIQEALGQTGGAQGKHAPVTVVASRDGGKANAMLNQDMLAQPGGGMFGGTGGGASINGAGVNSGNGGLSTAVKPDFDSLIDLVTQTIKPQSWQEVGGPGSIKPYETNLTLIVSQTQEAHEDIADLLEQLRRMQDLQVTIEVRFITLNDRFFERIGVDFDFKVQDKVNGANSSGFGAPDPAFTPVYTDDGSVPIVPRNLQQQTYAKPITVGLQSPGVFSADLDVPFQQGSFQLATPQFGGYDPLNAAAGTSVGFAILSDIETYFFIEASQGDRRTNVLQAPKVTLFNGQIAFVADVSQSPFVISVIPVVGDFAAAFQPVIVVLSEGTFLTVQAVVSKDRRFVRLTLVPFFSSIGNVDEFTFTGSSTTIKGSSNETTGTNQGSSATNETTVRSGTTVQLPTYNFVTVTTTVSVPDGGTVLLGGIKRLSEGRNEFGTPILNKLPYINRLFRNVGVGRETQSLMMMVTPRIIVQEEEEALILGNNP